MLKYLLEQGMIDGSCMTVTGKTMAENLAGCPPLSEGQDVRTSGAAAGAFPCMATHLAFLFRSPAADAPDFGIIRFIMPVESPIKPDGHLQILYGNLAPEGSVAKITGKEGLEFEVWPSSGLLSMLTAMLWMLWTDLSFV